MTLKAHYMALSSTASDAAPPSYDSVDSEVSYATPPSTSSSSMGPRCLWPASMEPFLYGPPGGDLPLEPAFASTWALPERVSAWSDVVEVWDSDVLNDRESLPLPADASGQPVRLHPRASAQAPGSRPADPRPEERVPRVIRLADRPHPPPVGYAHVRAAARRAGAPRQPCLRNYMGLPARRDRGARVNSREQEIWAAWAAYRDERGLPPWSEPSSFPDFWLAYNGEGSSDEGDVEAMLGTDTLHDWCEAYCADPGYLKSFELDKVVWGWDVGALRTTLGRVIKESGWNGTVTVELEYGPGHRVIVRPDNIYVYLRHSVWFVLLLVTMLYPLIYAVLLIAERHGGRYRTALATCECSVDWS